MEDADVDSEYCWSSESDVDDAEYGDTLCLLHEAVRKRHKQSVASLLKNGADINQQDEYGNTPLNIAAQDKLNCEIATMLLVEGADPSIPTNSNCFYSNRDPRRVPSPPEYTPFMTAIKSQNFMLQEQLLEYEVDFNFETFYGDSLLSLAIIYNSPFTEELVKRASDIHYHKSYDYFLVLCIHYSNVPVFKLLWNLTDYKRVWRKPTSIIPLCVEYGQYSILDFILESDKIKDVIEWIHETSSKEYTISLILDIFPSHTPEGKIKEIIYILLMNGYELNEYEAYCIYVEFGYDPLFELSLHLNPIIIPNLFECNLDEFVALVALRPTIPFNQIMDILSQNYSSSDITEEGEEIACHMLPSLLEFSRDAAREAICKNYNVAKTSDFYTTLKWLPLPRLIKDIIAFKQPIYP